MSTMTYKGYSAATWFDARDEIFVGKLQGITDSVTFHADTVNGLNAAMKEAVDDYISCCRKQGGQPNKPYSGKVSLQMPSTLHKDLEKLAREQHVSINEVIVSALKYVITHHAPR